MEIPAVILGQRLRKARKEKKLSQEQVAEGIGLSAFHLGRIERGKKSIYFDKLVEWCDYLNVPLEEIIFGASISINAEQNRQFSRLVDGCSPETVAAMLDVCRTIADIERRAKEE